MESLFVRSLALPPSVPPPHAHHHQQQQCLASASRTTADGTFAVAGAGVIRVYAASCAALLHEFAVIHARVHALHYTSFSDALVTLESAGGETFLCVYHDWRERRRVRGYTLPLGALESAAPADCVAVCSFTGRVVVAMGSVLNVWQCGRGFFEHVLELKVDMAQRHAFLQLEFVAIHGAYIAYASKTEVRVMEIHVRSAKEGDGDGSGGTRGSGAGTSGALSLHPTVHAHQQELGASLRQEPEDEVDCVHISSLDDVSSFVDVPIPCASYGDSSTGDQRDEKRIFEDQDPVQPMVLGRNVAQQEAWNLAGLIKSQDIRVNQALSYFVGESDVQVLLRRFLPPNHCVQALSFLPETIDNQVSVEARSYTRLLVSTEKNAFLYYFLSQEADLTRKNMSKKVFGGERHELHRTKSRGTHKPIKVGSGRALAAGVGRSRSHDSFSSVDDSDGFDDGAASTDDDEAESGRVVMFYQFSSPVSCIAANSSFLFVATLSDLQVWSIWSPCHYVAASRALSVSLVPQPSQPQLLCTQPIPFAAAQIAALDSYVVLLPKLSGAAAGDGEIFEQQVPAPYDFIRLGSMAAADRLPEDEFELRRLGRAYPDKLKRSVLIFQQSPPSLIFSYMRNAILSGDVEKIKPSQIDLLLSLFSLYRYRADVGLDLLHLSNTGSEDKRSVDDEKERLALELETKLYDTIAKACAADLASIFTSAAHRNLSRAALLYVASNVPSSEVMERFQAVVGTDNRAEVIDATSKYLEAFVFPSSESLPSIGASHIQGAAGATATGSSARTQRGAGSDRDFTRTVLLHYGKYAPEQLSRLIIDATLVWSLEDIAFGLEKLTESTSQSVLVRIATLVLILRALSFSASDWEGYKRSAAAAEELETTGDGEYAKSDPKAFLSMCSFESMTSHVKHLLDDHLDALIRLSVTHPELLVRVANGEEGPPPRFTTSAFALALRKNAPLVLLQILERVFTSAVRRQEAVLSSLLFCLSVFGDAAEPSIQRMAQYDAIKQRDDDDSKGATPSTPAPTTFVADQCFVLRLLVFVLEMFPSLEQLMEKEELHEDEDELKRVKAAIGLEMMALCVQLGSLVRSEDLLQSSQVSDLLLKLFDRHQAQHESSVAIDAQLPEWVHEYLETWCLPSPTTCGSEELRALLRFLFHLSIELQQEADLVSPVEILRVYEVKSAAKKRVKKAGVNAPQAPIWRLENDFAALIVLLTLPRVSRTVDGLQLIAKRADFVNLFLPYGKCYCVTLEEWSCLIKTLSAISEDSPEDESVHDEVTILENVLNHICSTLGPEDLLQVLPEDGDLALYMATIEASVRLGEAGRKFDQLHLAP